MGDLDRWRRQFETGLAADDGELCLAGLFWLAEGLTTLGSDRSNDFVLPPDLRAPGRIGTFTFGEGVLLFTPDLDCPVVCGDRLAVGTTRLAVGPDAPTLEIGPLNIRAVDRRGLAAVEVRSPLAAARLAFGGLRWFPESPAWRISAWVEGAVLRFPLEGHEQVWNASFDGEGGFVTFGDPTNGVDTSPAGRSLGFGPLREGRVVLDFNRAVTLPGARSPFGDPPPVANRTSVPIVAGEKYPHAGLWSGSGI